MRKWRSIIVAMICSILFVQVPAPSSAADGPISIQINDVEAGQATAFEREDTLYIPFRAVFEALGYSFEYEAETKMIYLEQQDVSYAIDIAESIYYTPAGNYQTLIPVLIVQNRTYIPEVYFEDLLHIQVQYDSINGRVQLQTPNYTFDETLKELARSYYENRKPPQELLTFDFDPYFEPVGEQHAFGEVDAFTKSVDIEIGPIRYTSLTEASATVVYRTETPFTARRLDMVVKFRAEEDGWRISRVHYIQIDSWLQSDVDDINKSVMEAAPAAAAKVLSDLKRNYEALNGNDVEAAIRAYSPLFIENWNRRSSFFSWERIVAHSIESPSSRRDLQEAKVLYIDDKTAVVYVKVLYTEFPLYVEDSDIHYEPEEPYEYEEVLYLDFADGERWTFNNGTDFN